MASKKTQAQVAKAQAEGEMPLDYMLRVMRDPKAALKRRDYMANAAAKYCHAQLQAIQHSGANRGDPVVFVMENRPLKKEAK